MKRASPRQSQSPSAKSSRAIERGASRGYSAARRVEHGVPEPAGAVSDAVEPSNEFGPRVDLIDYQRSLIHCSTPFVLSGHQIIAWRTTKTRNTQNGWGLKFLGQQ